MKINELEFNVSSIGEGFPFIWGHGLMSSMAAEDDSDWYHWDRMEEHVRLIRYDARGHGLSQSSFSAVDYTWRNLATDMLAVADSTEVGTFIAGGQSMGCATSIYTGLEEPDRVKGLVLVNPPTAWETRAEQASLYDRMAFVARLLGGRGLGWLIRRRPERLIPAWLVESMSFDEDAISNMIGDMDGKTLATILRGAALCDLPPRDELKTLQIPSLIFAWEGDQSHPVETAEILHQLLPNSEYHRARDIYDFKTWPLIMREFVQAVGPG